MGCVEEMTERLGNTKAASAYCRSYLGRCPTAVQYENLKKNLKATKELLRHDE